jgi:hypothetical protein
VEAVREIEHQSGDDHHDDEERDIHTITSRIWAASGALSTLIREGE